MPSPDIFDLRRKIRDRKADKHEMRRKGAARATGACSGLRLGRKQDQDAVRTVEVALFGKTFLLNDGVPNQTKPYQTRPNQTKPKPNKTKTKTKTKNQKPEKETEKKTKKLSCHVAS